MSRARVEIHYQCGRGAAKSKLEQYLAQKDFKRQSGKGITLWSLDWDKAVAKHIYPVYDDGLITLYAFISLLGRNKKYKEENLSGFDRFFSKMKLRRIVNGAKKLFEEDDKKR